LSPNEDEEDVKGLVVSRVGHNLFVVLFKLNCHYKLTLKSRAVRVFGFSYSVSQKADVLYTAHISAYGTLVCRISDCRTLYNTTHGILQYYVTWYYGNANKAARCCCCCFC